MPGSVLGTECINEIEEEYKEHRDRRARDGKREREREKNDNVKRIVFVFLWFGLCVTSTCLCCCKRFIGRISRLLAEIGAKFCLLVLSSFYVP